MNSKIYVITHKPFSMPKDDLYVPLHVGCQGKKSLGYIGDNTGDHISEKNPRYCELTGLYWMWKNMDGNDIVGLCHYRRYFFNNGELLKREYIEEMMKQYDIILPNSACTRYTSVYHHYQDKHKIEDLMECGKIIKEKYPADYAAFKWSIHTNFMSLGNMIITRKEILDEYCEWLFTILFEFEKRVDFSEYDEYQGRIMGFLSERLLRTWVLNREYKVREEQVHMVDENLHIVEHD